MKSNIETIVKNNGRVFVTSDLHGCYDKLIEGLDQIDFNYDEDLLIVIGDMVDRGKDSLSCINLIYKDWVKTTRGNHEDFCLSYINSTSNEERESIKQNHIANGGEWFYNLPYEVQVKLGSDIGNLPISIILERNSKKYLFIHADIPTYIKSLEDLKYFIDGESSESVITQCIWGRTKIRNLRNTKTESLYTIDGVNHVYLGHTINKDVITAGNMSWIDTGAVFDDYGYGKLTILEIT